MSLNNYIDTVVCNYSFHKVLPSKGWYFKGLWICIPVVMLKAICWMLTDSLCCVKMDELVFHEY